MKRICLILVLLLALLMAPSYAKPFPLFVVDDFEDSNISFNPEWFQFGDCSAVIKDNKELAEGVGFQKWIYWAQNHLSTPKPTKISKLGKQSLVLSGNTSHWYIGGIGTYLAIDARKYTHLVIKIRGWKNTPCRVKIEIYDDDNNNWQVEQDIANDFKPLFDDKFVVEIPVNWDGWKEVEIPFTAFKDVNPKVGDDKWNPFQTKTSGGLIQLQIVVLTPMHKEVGRASVAIDWIGFIRKPL